MHLRKSLRSRASHFHSQRTASHDHGELEGVVHRCHTTVTTQSQRIRTLKERESIMKTNDCSHAYMGTPPKPTRVEGLPCGGNQHDRGSGGDAGLLGALLMMRSGRITEKVLID